MSNSLAAQTFTSLLDYAYFKDAVVNTVEAPIDQDGFYFDRFIPENFVADAERDLAESHVAGWFLNGPDAHDHGWEDEGHVCYTCGTLYW